MPMQFRMALSVSTLTLAVAGSTLWAGAQQRQPGDVIKLAAEALGGAGRLRAIKTIAVAGYGETAYMNGGGNISASVSAPQKWIECARVREDARPRAPAHARSSAQSSELRLRGGGGLSGGANAATAYLDGDVAYNGGPNGRLVRATDQAAGARRLDMMNNPVALVRAALDRPAAVSNPRTESPWQVADITLQTGEKLTLAITAGSGLPAWVRWTAHDENLGDVIFRTTYTGYLPVKGVMLPMGYQTVIDFRNVVQNKIYVDKNAVDDPIDDLSAPADVRSAPAPRRRRHPPRRRPSARASGCCTAPGAPTPSFSSSPIT